MRAKRSARLFNPRYSISFDAILNRTRRYGADIPQYPVEEGFKYQESILKKPLELSLMAVISNTPVQWIEKQGGVSRYVPCVTYLQMMYFSGQLFTLEAGGYKWTNMAIQSISIPEKEGNLDYSEVSISLKQANLAEEETVLVDYVFDDDTKKLGELAKEQNVSGVTAQGKDPWADLKAIADAAGSFDDLVERWGGTIGEYMQGKAYENLNDEFKLAGHGMKIFSNNDMTR